MAISYNNFESHLISDTANYGESFNLGAGQNYLILNWYTFNKFMIYMFCPFDTYVSPFATNECAPNSRDKYRRQQYSLGLP